VSTRTGARLGWTLWTLTVVLLGGYLALYAARGARVLLNSSLDLVEDVFGAVVLLTFATLGALIVWRQPGNRVGWIFGAIGLVWAVERFAQVYATYVLIVEPGVLPGGLAAAWVQNWTWTVFSGLLYVFLPLLFPNGQLLSARWSPVAWLGATAVTLMVVGEALHTGKLANLTFLTTFDNPIGFDPLDLDTFVGVGGLFGVVVGIGFLLALISMLAAAVSLVVRLRRAEGEERQQLKWFAYFGSILAILFVIQALVRAPHLSTPEFEIVYRWTYAIAFACLPLATGLAILRYRLYEIDVLINRTLVYGALTVTLGLVYYGSVVLLQGLFRAFTGQQYDLAIVGSTLAIAALFQPLRRRIQNVIDRRFSRQKYEAARVLAAFSPIARDEVDLDKLTARLLAVVDQTMHPIQVSLWPRWSAATPGKTIGVTARESEGERSA
jgi:hypothetical protein